MYQPEVNEDVPVKTLIHYKHLKFISQQEVSVVAQENNRKLKTIK